MHFGSNLSRKHLMWFLILSAFIIFMASVEVLITVKSASTYAVWAEHIGGASREGFGDFIALNMGLYFSKIIVPVIFAIYSWVVYSKLKVNGLYVFIWTVLLVGNLFIAILGKSLLSPLFWLNLMAYVLLILGLVSCIFDKSHGN